MLGGRLIVGAIPTIAPYLLPAVLREMRRRTGSGEIDLSIAAVPIEHEQLHVEPLLTEDLLVALSVDHPLSKKRRLQLNDIQNERFILLHEATVFPSRSRVSATTTSSNPRSSAAVPKSRQFRN